MWNTLLAYNFPEACAGLVGSIEESHNLADDRTCLLDQDGDLEVADAGILPLDDHGGPTDTHALDLASLAIDAATADHCPAADQRTFARPAFDACDIGAVERRPSPVVNTTADGNDGACDEQQGDCTLREALEDSERDSQIFLGDGDYKVTLGELQLRGNRSIIGQNARTTTISASGGHRVLSVDDGTSTVAGVRITGGVAASQALGGGILVAAEAFLSLEDSAVEGNSAPGGGGIANMGQLFVTSSTIAANDANAGPGGGLLMGLEAGSFLVNSTVSGNTAKGAGGGIANLGGHLDTWNVTIADNRAPAGGGVYGDAEQVDANFWVGDTEMTNTIVATNTGGACLWATAQHDRLSNHSLADDGSCHEAGQSGNLVVADARLGPLESRFGATDVHPLLAGSPAIDAADDVFCFGIDQRGAERPDGAHCDIGAFEGGVAVTTLRVVTQVIDGPTQPADVFVRVYSGGKEVDSSRKHVGHAVHP